MRDQQINRFVNPKHFIVERKQIREISCLDPIGFALLFLLGLNGLYALFAFVSVVFDNFANIFDMVERFALGAFGNIFSDLAFSGVAIEGIFREAYFRIEFESLLGGYHLFFHGRTF
jgi:hypothetical protein